MKRSMNMPKQRLIKLVDMILIFDIILFFSGAVNQFGENRVNVFLFLGFGFFNLVFLIQIIRLRKHYNRNLLKDIEFEEKAEEMIDEEVKESYRKTKQIHLENIIEVKLEEAFPTMKILRNAYIRQSDGKDTQIDIIAIHSKGVFVIESKNMTGEIQGNWKDKTLNINHPGGKKYPLYNPIMQNRMHIERISNLLGMHHKDFKNIVVFGGRTHVTSFEGVPYDTRITFRETLVNNLKALMKYSKTSFTDREVQKIHDDLQEHTFADQQREQEHLDNVKFRLNKEH